MPRFCAQQAEIMALTDAMIGGYSEHPALFPSADVPLVQSVGHAYYAGADTQREAMAASRIASEAKQAALRSVDDGAGTLLIEWGRPPRSSGGPIRTYIIESRESNNRPNGGPLGAGGGCLTDNRLAKRPAARRAVRIPSKSHQ